MNAIEINGRRVMLLDGTGPLLGSERDATDLIGECYGQAVELIAIPVSRLHADFFELKTQMAGFFLQKMQSYGFRFAAVGDISAKIAASKSLRDFVYESNKVGQVLFVADLDELKRRL